MRWSATPLFLFGGAKRDRTADLYNAIVALSQLSYGPETLSNSVASPFAGVWFTVRRGGGYIGETGRAIKRKIHPDVIFLWMNDPPARSPFLVLALHINDLAHILVLAQFRGVFEQHVVFVLDNLFGLFL